MTERLFSKGLDAMRRMTVAIGFVAKARRLMFAAAALLLGAALLPAPVSAQAFGQALAPPPPSPEAPLDKENTLYLDLEYGRVVIRLRPDLAPKHITRIKELVRDGFYDGTVFHRVIEGFMAQTGDPKGNGTGGSGKNIPAEFNDGKHVRGALSMARSASINSADSQFFIVLADSPMLDHEYTYWGEVVSGMEFVDRVRKGDPNEDGMVPYPDRIVQMQVAADAKGDYKPLAAEPN